MRPNLLMPAINLKAVSPRGGRGNRPQKAGGTGRLGKKKPASFWLAGFRLICVVRRSSGDQIKK
jgi:hypothetical protein